MNRISKPSKLVETNKKQDHVFIIGSSRLEFSQKTSPPTIKYNGETYGMNELSVIIDKMPTSDVNILVQKGISKIFG